MRPEDHALGAADSLENAGSSMATAADGCTAGGRLAVLALVAVIVASIS